MKIPQQQTVLIVDDVETNVLLLERILSRLEVDTVCVYNGWDALAVLNERPVDLVLLDINMPGIDGYTVLRHIREVYDMRTLPVILVSANNSDKYVVAGLDLGANDYITKPFSNKIIRQRVQTQLHMRQLAHENEQALAAAQASDALKTQLLRIASHDLKNPLNNLLLLFEMFADGEPVPAEFIAMANTTTQKMLDIVTDFLDAGVLDEGVIQMHMAPVDIGALTESVVMSFEQAAARKGIVLEVALAPCVVQADERRLAQVVTNLVSNAIKYTHPNTTVRVYGTPEAGGYRVDVFDQGDGVPQSEMHRLFQPFAQLSTRPTAGEDSNGLGLYIVKQMAEAQGGRVGVDTTYTDGADFYVWLPLAP